MNKVFTYAILESLDQSKKFIIDCVSSVNFKVDNDNIGIIGEITFPKNMKVFDYVRDRTKLENNIKSPLYGDVLPGYITTDGINYFVPDGFDKNVTGSIGKKIKLDETNEFETTELQQYIYTEIGSTNNNFPFVPVTLQKTRPETANLFTFFQIGDLITIKMGYLPDLETHKFYITGIKSSAESIVLELENWTFMMKKIPVKFSTPKDMNIKEFIEKYVIYFIVSKSYINKVVINDYDYITNPLNVIGRLRVKPGSFFEVLKILKELYNFYWVEDSKTNTLTLNFGYGFVIRKNANKQNFISNIKAMTFTTDNNIFTKILQNLNPQDYKIVVRATSLYEEARDPRRKLTKNDKNLICEAIYGDLEALSGNGTMLNIRRTNLNQRGINEYAKNYYTKMKFLRGNNNISIKPLFNEELRIYDLFYIVDRKDTSNNAYYMIKSMTRQISLSGGYEINIELSLPLRTGKEVDEIIKNLRMQ